MDMMRSSRRISGKQVLGRLIRLVGGVSCEFFLQPIPRQLLPFSGRILAAAAQARAAGIVTSTCYPFCIVQVENKLLIYSLLKLVAQLRKNNSCVPDVCQLSSLPYSFVAFIDADLHMIVSTQILEWLLHVTSLPWLFPYDSLAVPI